MSKPKTRLYVTDDLASGRVIRLDPERAHYLRHVLRLERGDAVALFNGRDGEWRAVIDGVGKGWCTLSVAEARRPQAGVPDLWLLFAPIKSQRIDSVAEKATELGVSLLWPVFTRHTDVTRVNTQRLHAHAVAAAEQCERLCVPVLREPVPLERALADWPESRLLLLCAEAGPARPLAEVLATPAAQGPAAILVGPEGGFAPAELADLRARPFVVPVGLGPRVLRADTAAFAALAVWQALRGDWRGEGAATRPPFRAGAAA